MVPEDLESILTEAVESGLPQRWLSWHYRSHDESLIAFSNRFYYEGKLSSLPVARAGRRGRHHLAPASTAGSTGAPAGPTRSRRGPWSPRSPAGWPTRPPPTESIGVVTFNLQQRDLILNLLEESTDPLVRKALADGDGEPVFVKNLENVQGDERDVVLFSLAFAKDPKTGQLPLNFGPLSQAGGERRLNVAITRARRSVVLFAASTRRTSTCPAPRRWERRTCGPTANWRRRARPARATSALDRPGAQDRVRDELAQALRERGFEVRTGYGLSDFTVDIAVRAPGAAHWQVAVLLDSPRWAGRPTVADRDGAPELLRTVMGWPEVVRCWLPAWIRGRTEVLDRVAAAVARASTVPPTQPAPDPAPADGVESPPDPQPAASAG